MSITISTQLVPECQSIMQSAQSSYVLKVQQQPLVILAITVVHDSRAVMSD